ncbi:MAG: hypothetical protein FD180_264 [Planctomycetota bacterium]|nr:MAG: hypothetical protein FD180_264 [Planctomycetota bacterium]
MRSLPVIALVLAAGAARAEGPVTLAWKAADGDEFIVAIHSKRRSEIQTDKQPLPVATRFEVKVKGTLKVRAAAEDGSRKCEFTFATLEGTVEALGMKLPIAEKPEDVFGKMVTATLSRFGRLTWDEEAVRKVAEGVDLTEDLAHLLPALPLEPVSTTMDWEAEVDGHRDTYEIKSLEVKEDRTVAVFGGKSKADETTGEGELKTTLRVDGTFSGEWDVDGGHLKHWKENRTEEAKIVGKDSMFITKSELTRDVTVGRKKKD